MIILLNIIINYVNCFIITQPTIMERIPVFMYNKVDGSHDLSFLRRTSFDKSTLSLNDHLTGKSFIVHIPSGIFNGYIIVHFDGYDHVMIGIEDHFIRSLMKQKLTKEMMTKFMERGVRYKRSSSLRKSKMMPKPSKLSRVM